MFLGSSGQGITGGTLKKSLPSPVAEIAQGFLLSIIYQHLQQCRDPTNKVEPVIVSTF